MKEGKKTTEFYITLLGSILGVIVALGYLTPEQASGLTECAATVSGAIVTACSILGYNISRGMAKKKNG